MRPDFVTVARVYNTGVDGGVSLSEFTGVVDSVLLGVGVWVYCKRYQVGCSVQFLWVFVPSTNAVSLPVLPLLLVSSYHVLTWSLPLPVRASGWSRSDVCRKWLYAAPV